MSSTGTCSGEIEGPCSAEYLIDDSLASIVGTSTAYGDTTNPWLEIDLGGSKRVDWVSLYHKYDATPDDFALLGTYELWLGDESARLLVLCAAATAPATFAAADSAPSLTHSCGNVARYVTVGDSDPNPPRPTLLLYSLSLSPLHLLTAGRPVSTSAVYVYGVPTPPSAPTPPLLPPVPSVPPLPPVPPAWPPVPPTPPAPPAPPLASPPPVPPLAPQCGECPSP
eukprot:3090326-Prymnesium_polylepis.1